MKTERIQQFKKAFTLLPSTVAGAIALLTGGSYILSATFGRKNFLTILKNKEIVRTMIKKNVNDK